MTNQVNGSVAGQRRMRRRASPASSWPPGWCRLRMTARETTAASFKVSVEDGNEDGSAPVAQTFNFTVTPVNDPPVLTGDLTATVAEGGSYVITGGRSWLQRPGRRRGGRDVHGVQPGQRDVAGQWRTARRASRGQQLAAGQVSVPA